MNSQKNRDLSILEFFECLQKEYFVAEVRKKIYPSPKDKAYYKKVMAFKKEKINDIAFKNKLQSIFTDDDIRNQYINEVYPDLGLPKFELTTQDIINYYGVDADVKINIDGKIYFGKIVRAELKKNIVYVKIRREQAEKPFNILSVTRIL